MMLVESTSAHRALQATSPNTWITQFTKDNGCALFGFEGCSYCTQAKDLFKSKGAHVGYCDIQDSSTTPTGQEIFRALKSRTNLDTELQSSGRLDAALAEAGCVKNPTANPTTAPSNSGSGSNSWVNSEPSSWGGAEAKLDD
ncbi:hypothetical protein SPRG_13861 [Saprolegnia parasitica CBS 223.65]|uniref:Glutaredoxin domain-containing protein n=1 Tax=Saprolegnia parasitica (strain CBS 223.65) TaxID=695850 RepID=A0A067BS34_SAPPC|nr:hypothetical protein SPRG_13861 [Saprolegnia parasitica CBS 223.65]KDO21068.1 hypothetical protein SPRG_13861 [Saprolegnia parasitica CBS 223.65]|eukprot:XP_012208247.1 hypothetical protein SPRG_13861 [Saprolegnia parasitica CBS 223.65]